MEFGRPTEYNPKYCGMLEEHCKQGASFESFAAEIGVSSRTLHNWRENNPDFFQSAEIAYDNCRKWWEERLRESASGITTKETVEATDANGNKVYTTIERGKVNAGSVQFALSNFFRKEWNNRQEIEHTGQMPVQIVGVEGFKGFGDVPKDEPENTD